MQSGSSSAWPFVEAQKILDRLAGQVPAKGYVLFETGYGPSGLPHIGTFGEVLRTSMIRHAFMQLSDIPTRLIAFSDDMDGLRKVPGNVPNPDILERHLNWPLTRIPDPFGTHESFGHHNNAELCRFLDQFGFDYEFASSSDYYQSGKFDPGLRAVLDHYDRITKIMQASLRQERSETYSPFLPIDEESGQVLQVPVLAHDAKAGTITYQRPNGQKVEVPVTGGRCKLQWKPDWAMRWHVLDVNYEMSGKDLIDSVRLSGQICKILGSQPPEGFTYELFLDENGEKISKSKGNGLSIDEWLTYGTKESLGLFMYQKPKSSKRLYFDVIPKLVDDYQTLLAAYPDLPEDEKTNSPIYHLHPGGISSGSKERANDGPGLQLLINLVSASNSMNRDILWGFVKNYAKGTSPESHPDLDHRIDLAIRYYRDFVKPAKSYRLANEEEKQALNELYQALSSFYKDNNTLDGEAIQTLVYQVGKAHYSNLRDWFKIQYQILLGQDSGPRIGSFFALYGLENSLVLIDRARSGHLVTDEQEIK